MSVTISIILLTLTITGLEWASEGTFWRSLFKFLLGVGLAALLLAALLERG